MLSCNRDIFMLKLSSPTDFSVNCYPSHWIHTLRRLISLWIDWFVTPRTESILLADWFPSKLIELLPFALNLFVSVSIFSQIDLVSLEIPIVTVQMRRIDKVDFDWRCCVGCSSKTMSWQHWLWSLISLSLLLVTIHDCNGYWISKW